MNISDIKQKLFQRFGIMIDESKSTEEIEKEIDKREDKEDIISCMEIFVLKYAVRAVKQDRYP
jgi:hypothetical protein